MEDAVNLMVVDFETYYDPEFSLSKIPTDEYVLSPLYETMGVSVKNGYEDIKWFSGTEQETADWLAQFPWATSAVVCHNVLFDAFILAQRFGIKPKLWMCTKGMATALYPYLKSFSLAALCKHFGLPDKGTEVKNMLGRRRATLSPGELQAYGEYCKLDVELTYQLANLFTPRLPAMELRLIDLTARMFVEPRFIGDQVMLRELYERELARKVAIVALASTDRAVLQSNDKFAAKLTELGVSAPTKRSLKTGKVTWAFAKTDAEFTALLSHENPDVQALVSARLGIKSTIAETRALNMLKAAQRGPLPVYLNYWGAKVTGRYSGGNGNNYQNLPARGPSAGIRYAVGAPEGHSVVVCDSSNIELRVAMVIARQMDVVQKIRDKVDLYCDFAGKMFGRTITKADKRERTLGKLACLSLQYGAGWRKFKEMVRIQADITLTDGEAESIVQLYRRTHYKVVDMWERMQEVVLPEIASGNHNLLPVDDLAWCMCTGEGFGLAGYPGVVYHDLHMEDGEWMYTMADKPVKIYAGKCFENLCQHVARQIVMWQTVCIADKYPVSLTVHDEAVCVVPDDQAEACKAYMEQCMATAPAWCKNDIPLACEAGIGKTYGDAK